MIERKVLYSNYPEGIRGNKEVSTGDIPKPRYDLISPIALEELARVYTFGCKKYAPRNWEKGIPFSEMFAAMMRHAWAWMGGSNYDYESGYHILAHVAFWCFAIIHLSYTRPMFDDRMCVVRDNDKVEKYAMNPGSLFAANE